MVVAHLYKKRNGLIFPECPSHVLQHLELGSFWTFFLQFAHNLLSFRIHFNIILSFTS